MVSDHAAYRDGEWNSDLEHNATSMPTSTANSLPQQAMHLPVGPDGNPIYNQRNWRPAVDDDSIVYNSYAGVDIVATLVLPGEKPINFGELQTLSYSIHRENSPVRLLGHTSPVGFVKGSRTIAGSMIFTVFNNYAFYRLRQYQAAIENRLYPVADMLPPFDLVLTFGNEFGVFSKMKILGVTFIDEGGTMSVDDLIQEQTYSYMARGIQPLTGYYLPEISEPTEATGTAIGGPS